MPPAAMVVLLDTYSLRTIFEEHLKLEARIREIPLKLRCFSLRICLHHFENEHIRIQLIQPFAHICIIFYQQKQVQTAQRNIIRHVETDH